MTDLSQTIAECLAAHAEAVDRFGTDRPELADAIPPELRSKMQRQRAKVDATLQGDNVPAHVAHLEALTKGLRLVMRRLEGSRGPSALGPLRGGALPAQRPSRRMRGKDVQFHDRAASVRSLVAVLPPRNAGRVTR
jgi:hypothetical protein